MTIGTELTQVQTTASNIKTQITNQGQTVETTDSWLDLVTKIDKIKNNGSDYTQNVLEEVLSGTIENLYDESLAYIRPSCFRFCTKLKVAEFVNITKICSNAFRSCYNFKTLILPGSFVKLDNTNAFLYTQISQGTIYVADSLVNTYKNAANWSQFASRIQPVSQYEEEIITTAS